jgi:hypothetical protein
MARSARFLGRNLNASERTVRELPKIGGKAR